jgi:adenosylhomocysteine nucleosidase
MGVGEHMEELSNKRNLGRVYVVTALYWEAQPIIQKYKLKRNTVCRHFPVYQGNDMMLVVGGVGKMASAIATSYLLARGGAEQGTVVFNIGICGSGSREYPIGMPVLIHQIIDKETGRQYFPDILIEHPFLEGNIETHNRVVKLQNSCATSLEERADFVDMESAGFFEAASHFVAPHQIYVIKVIGDYMDKTNYNHDKVTCLIGGSLESIDEFVGKVKKFCKPAGAVFILEEQQQLEAVKKSLRLTVTQGHQLIDTARKYKIGTGKALPDFSDIIGRGVRVKNEGKKAFERIRNILSIE